MIEIIVNSKHKKSLLELEKIENILNREKIEYRVLKTSETKNAQKLMDEVSSKQIIVIGGDGTINEVINNYHEEDIIYLAQGSGNDLARSLQLERSSSCIIKLINSSDFNVYDVGDVNGKKFCSGFDIGFNADVIERVEKSRLKKYFGSYIYLVEGVITILKLKKYYAKIQVGDSILETDKLRLLNVMIQSYEGGGIRFSNTATGRDGQFHIMIMADMSWFRFVYNYICLLLNKHNKLKGIKVLKADSLSVETSQPYYQIDGELVAENKKMQLKCIKEFYKIKKEGRK
ncbi:Putative lipid kinase YtlR [Gemella morbillorum]|uniref:diacylglycerol/lipid kinase family protein n=1 Tax=Gemella morbillorum TaxID=29391 RepID=UPI000DA2C7C0|nr:diacylglycerol kinase family protein [Gemella morbillorum]UBH80751.1 diacylglycerol kinase [Gemella morbillorum]SQH56154.1 Putative lipid kinase YtlR [Gemella morbillorum]